MDVLDKKILRELDLNCRQSYAQIARKVRSSRAVVGYRIKRLEKQGVIKKYITAVNLGKLGFNTYKLYFKVFGHEEQAEKDFISYVIKLPKVIHFMKTQGAFDFSLVIATKNINDLDEIISDLKNNFSNIIRDYRLSIIVSSRVFGRAKLFLAEKDKCPKVENFSGATDTIHLDDKDVKILCALSNDASLPILDLAKKTGLSMDVIKYRMKKLVKQGIINNFRLLFSADKLGFYHYVFLLNIKQATKADEERINTWGQLNDRVMYITKRVGFWDFELNVALKDIDDFNKFVAELEKEFSKIINSYETIII
ncbi:MAG: Lrp/AsnC family transcriptional regulator, partial [Nanoarchaeota archaeon]|nr:Lrp/AsnC family transcriptional regulator [Nanoarchaeota archaeon]